MKLESRQEGQSLVLMLEFDRLEIGNAMEFREALDKGVPAGTKRLIIDLSKVDYVDSSGLGVLIACQRFFKDSGGEVILAGARAKVAQTFQTTHLDLAIPIFPDVAAALKAGQ